MDRGRFFISHNAADKDYARALATRLRMVGSDVWFDEWKIKPGDSIPAAISTGLGDTQTFVLVWSQSASQSHWVQEELNAAINSMITTGVRFVAIKLDTAPLPSLVAHRKYLGSSGDVGQDARTLLGMDSERGYLKALQIELDEMGIEMREIWGGGTFVACPKCGASPSTFKVTTFIDEMRDDEYRDVTCGECGSLIGGGEI